MTLQERAKVELEARSRKQILASWEIAMRDAYYFLTHFLYTLDPHYSGGIHLFPNKRYLEYLTEQWLQYRLLLVPKSRQMMISWLFVGLYTWETFAFTGRYTFFQSRKEELSGYGSPLSLLSRTKFIYDHFPEVIQRKYFIQTTKRPPLFTVTNNSSVIHAVSQDADVGKTYTATGILADELAAQTRAREAMISVMPTLGDKGKYTGVSTPKGKKDQLGVNLFYGLVSDKIDIRQV